MKNQEEFQPDSVVTTITERFIARAKFGKTKYNTDLDRTDLSPTQWAQHIMEEMHDAMLYMEKWKREQEKQMRLLHLIMKGTSTATILHLDSAEESEYQELRLWYKEHNQQ